MVLTFTGARRQGSRSASNGQRFCMCVRRRWEEEREETREECPSTFPLFFFFFDITEGGTTGTGERKSEQTGGSRGGGASGFFRCPTFRGGGGNSGFTRPSQGQTLLFMQPGREQTPGTLQRQATSHAQRSLVITGSAAWPRHSHVNIHTGRHFAWKSVINDPNQRKWRISTCNVNVLGYDTTNAQAIINSKGKHVDRIVVFNASMTCLEEYAAGLRLHRV